MSSQEELEDACKGTQWENNIGPNDFEEVTNNNDDNNDDEDTDEEEEDNWNES